MANNKIIPGVYYQEIEDNVVNIQQLPQGVVGIVGTADAGPLNTPTRCRNWAEFVSYFGGWRDELTGPKSFLAVRRQGCEEIYFCRIAGSTKSKATKDFNQSGSAKASLQLVTRGGGAGVKASLTINADDVILTGDTTTASAVVDDISDTSSLSAGMSVSGTGISAGTTIASVDSATQITLSDAATADGDDVSLTFNAECVTLESIETGASENTITVTVVDGTSAGYSNVTIAKAGFTTETYSNVRVKSGDIKDLVAIINGNSKLVRATRIVDDIALDTLSATTMSGGVDSGINSIELQAKQAGTEGNSITVQVLHGETSGRVNVTITDGVSSELFEDVYIDGTGSKNLVALINASSSLVTATQIASTGTGPENNPHTTAATALSGGTAATVAFTLTASDYGKYGDQLKISIQYAISGGNNIYITDSITGNVLESFLNVADSDVVSTINDESKLVEATAGSAGALEEVELVALASGDNGASTTDSDYIGTIDANGNRTGLYALGGTDVITVQVAAQQSSIAINQANVAICEEEGDRIAVISLQESGSLDEIKERAALTDSKYAAQAWPWKVAPHPVTGEDLSLTPAEFLAGTLAANAINRSPSNKAILWAYRDTPLELGPTSNEMESLIQSHIVPSARKRSTLDPTGRFVWMAGVTTSSSSYNKDKQISVIRPYLNIVESLVEGLDPYVSENNTAHLRAAVRYSSTGLLRRFVDDGTLMSYSLQCDGTNNPEADAQQGYLYVDVSLYFAYPADFIVIRVKRDPAGNLSAS